jgi:hypothetical protein
VNILRGVDLQFSDVDLTMSIQNFSKQFIQPAVSLLANNIDMDVAGMVRKVSNSVGTPGTTPNTRALVLQAGKILKNNAVQDTRNLKLICDPAMEAAMSDLNISLFNPSGNISKIFENGEMGRALGFDWFMDQNVTVQTYGAGSGTPVVAGASQAGYTINTSGWTASTAVLNHGDVIYFAGSYDVNPVGKQNLNYLKAFAVVGPVTSTDANGNPIYGPLTSDGSGNLEITLATPLIPASGATVVAPFGSSPVTLGSAYQNVTASPASGAAVTLFAAGHTGVPSAQNIAFHKDAFTLACVDLEMVKGTDMCARVSDDQLGLSIRLVRDFVVGTNQRVTRLDILYGLQCVRPEWAVRIAG